MLMLFLCLLLVCCAVCVLDCFLFQTVVLSLLAAAAAVVLAYLILISCRSGHPAWEKLSRYRYAHRGFHDALHGAPENSIAAFQRALDYGYGVELDVHLTRDGRLAVIHDNNIRRTVGVDGVVSKLSAKTLSLYHLEGTEEKIPFLEEVLPLFEGKTPLIIELKVDGSNAAALAEAVCTMLDRYQVDFCIESFHPGAIQWLARNRPEICRGQLSENYLRKRGFLPWPAAFVMANLLTNFLTNPDFIAYNVLHRAPLSLRLCRSLWGAHELSWTIRTQDELDACERDGRIPIFEGFIPS